MHMQVNRYSPPTHITPFNTAIFSAFSTSLKNVVIAAQGPGATVTQLNTLATTFAISVQEMQNIGAVASFQSALTAQANDINAYDPSQANISALQANAQRPAPFQYATVQQAVQQIDTAAKTAVIAGNGLRNTLSGFEADLQKVTGRVASSGGTLQTSNHNSRGNPHIQDVYCMAPEMAAGFFLSAIFSLGGSGSVPWSDNLLQ
ncbi:MAG: hypothetical protein ACP5EP_03095 [Acidobacteriaceae bacterium]